MIYIDISAAVHSRAGLGRYCERVALHVTRQLPQNTTLFFNQGSGGQIPASLIDIPYMRVKAGYKPWRMAVLMAHHARVGFNRIIPDATLFHSTEHLLFPLRDVPTVLTIHDLIFKLFPEHHKRLNYWYLNWAVPIFAERASHLIAVSEASKRDVVREYGIDPSKITVIYEAADTNFRPPSQAEIDGVRQKYNLPDEFLLHLSTIEPRKNLTRLVDALKIVRRNRPNLQFRLVGSKGWLYDDFFAKLERENLTEIVQPLGWVPDEDLPAVIAAASLAVQPSLYEGFGLPILEHMGTGQVVAASNAASHPEVGGEAAAYFDPNNVEEMAAVIGRILNAPDEYQHRRELGLQQAARFNWQHAARQTIAVYDQLLTRK